MSRPAKVVEQQAQLVRYLYRKAKEQHMAISIRLPTDIETRLSRLAAKTGRTKTFYVTEAIEEQISDLEDRYLAERRLAANKAGKSKSFSLDDVERDLGLEN